MADFVLSARAKRYFDELNKKSGSGHIAHDLEEWWLCAQIGLLADSPGDAPESGSPGMVDYFIKTLGPHQARIRGLLLMRHLRKVDAGGMNRELLEREMANMLGDSKSKLTDYAVKELNKYATGGFEIIQERIGGQTDLFVFMLEYHDLISSITVSTGE